VLNNLIFQIARARARDCVELSDGFFRPAIVVFNPFDPPVLPLLVKCQALSDAISRARRLCVAAESHDPSAAAPSIGDSAIAASPASSAAASAASTLALSRFCSRVFPLMRFLHYVDVGGFVFSWLSCSDILVASASIPFASI
jgi:hypothetical protein